ncbi:MAG TPA: T9SS type A sorting domain-containing protein [Bacteroidales bacterium]|nr:T9SS type A sorting domain-containing protein [Bacteroidales bacterium]HPS16756.1 T9SS type A sorting domain-containing protein [Bacteroidales bacterium]
MKIKLKIYYLFLYILPGFSFGQNTIINSGVTIVNTNNFISKGNFINDGTYTDNTGTVVFSGNTQEIDGTSSTSFNNITVSSGSTTTVTTSGHSVKGILLSNGTLNADGNITLLSTASKTAMIDGSGSGDVLGNIIMQRYLASGFGYKYLSSPFQSATVNELSDDIDLGVSFATLYRYDESQINSGWISYINTSGILNPMEGYSVNFGAVSSPVTFDIKGEVNNGDLQTTLYNNNKTYTKGFNLVGNPYPSPIDWDASSGWTKTNIDDALYFFNAGTTNQYKGTYSTYINGVSSDGIVNSIIPSMQGVFVHVSNGTFPVSATLGFSNEVRINDLAPSFHKKELKQDIPLLRLIAYFKDNASYTDPVVIYFNNSASMNFEKDYDALKIFNSDDLIPNLYVATPDAAQLSICSMPYPADSLTTVPLGITTESDGWVLFKAKDIYEMPSDIHVYLYDTKTGYYNLHDEQECHLYLKGGEYENRFYIVFSKKDLQYFPTTDEKFFAYGNNNKLFVYLNLQNNETGNLLVSNLLGQTVYKEELNGNGYHEIDVNINRGVYIITLQSTEYKYSKKIFISDK